MLTVVRDDYGMLQAACDWWLVDGRGHYDVHGETVWVNQLEVNQPGDTKRLIELIVQEIAALVPWVRGAYWERRDKPRIAFTRHYFSRRQLLREGVRVG